MQPGDVVYVAFPFSDQGTSKDRPALVLGELGDLDVTICAIVSHTNDMDRVDLSQSRMAEGYIPKSCYIRPFKIATVQKGDISRHLGRVHPDVLGLVRQAIVDRIRY